MTRSPSTSPRDAARHALQVSSGTGPVEVRRFVAALTGRLEELVAARGLLLDELACHGEELEPRSATLYLRGDATGLLADQLGTHELVHRSPDRGRAARKRWFAAVSLHSIAAPAAAAAAVPADELEVSVCRAGGPGGQHVNKVSTAIRVRHLPTGLTVRCACSRSQLANREQALARLAELLAEQAASAAARAASQRRLAHYRVERGRPVWSYVLDASGALVAQ
jgi:peptide chain release factor 2/peptide chain release factor